MNLTTVPLSSLLAPRKNPRTSYDQVHIAGLAQSIRADGVLQNLLVRPDGRDKYRVVAGQRRYLALQLLKKERVIDGTYPVPVDIKEGLDDGDLLRIATIENVQREPLAPMDEAEAFALMLQGGASVEDVAAKAGVSIQTVKRRAALASLCDEAKSAVRTGQIGLSVAEALTVGTHGQQRAMLAGLEEDYLPDVDEIRAMLIGGKPSLVLALFPADRYTGTFTSDLFSDETTTFFDDVEQFMALQKEAVEALAEKHRATAAWVDMVFTFHVPWWQFDQAPDGEPGGVIIHLHPSGAVEVRDHLVKHAVEETVAEETQETPAAPKPAPERPAFNAPLMRYVAHQKTAAVQAAMLRNPRKAKEVAALLLLQGIRLDFGIRLSLHHALLGPPEDCGSQRSFGVIEGEASSLADRLGLDGRDTQVSLIPGIDRLMAGRGALGLLESLGRLADDELDRLMVLLPILCFGQEHDERFDTGNSLFNAVAQSLGIEMRDWWTPTAPFFASLLRDQLVAVVTDTGASESVKGAGGLTKKELVAALAQFFASAEGSDSAIKRWLPGMFRFPANPSLGSGE